MLMAVVGPTHDPSITNFTKTIGIFPFVFLNIFDRDKIHYITWILSLNALLGILQMAKVFPSLTRSGTSHNEPGY